jgi:SMC interacting uncharacterized protein involved in chromosome segregation
MLRFSNIPGSPPTLNNGKDDVPLNNYIIGSPIDPHWKIYPKDQFYTAPHSSPSLYAFTDYVYDAHHFVFYMPETSGPTMNYSMLLRDHFNNIRHQILEQARREAERKAQENQTIINSIKSRITQDTAMLNEYIKMLKQLEKKRDGDIRAVAGRGNRTPEAMAKAAAMVDAKEPMYNQLLSSIEILKANIQRDENELKIYM